MMLSNNETFDLKTRRAHVHTRALNFSLAACSPWRGGNSLSSSDCSEMKSTTPLRLRLPDRSRPASCASAAPSVQPEQPSVSSSSGVCGVCGVCGPSVDRGVRAELPRRPQTASSEERRDNLAARTADSGHANRVISMSVIRASKPLRHISEDFPVVSLTHF